MPTLNISQAKAAEMYRALGHCCAVSECAEKFKAFLGADFFDCRPEYPTWADLPDTVVRSLYRRGFNAMSNAALQMAYLIEVSYGGVITEEEWEDDSKLKWRITPTAKNYERNWGQRWKISSCSNRALNTLPSFHTKEQAEAFLRFNKPLLEMYYMLTPRSEDAVGGEQPKSED